MSVITTDPLSSSGREGMDDGSGERCLRLDLSETDRAYGSLGFDASFGAPPLCAPARVIPGRTLSEDEVGLVPVPPLKFNVRRLGAVERPERFLFPPFCSA